MYSVRHGLPNVCSYLMASRGTIYSTCNAVRAGPRSRSQKAVEGKAAGQVHCCSPRARLLLRAEINPFLINALQFFIAKRSAAGTRCTQEFIIRPRRTFSSTGKAFILLKIQKENVCSAPLS